MILYSGGKINKKISPEIIIFTTRISVKYNMWKSNCMESFFQDEKQLQLTFPVKLGKTILLLDKERCYDLKIKQFLCDKINTTQDSYSFPLSCRCAYQAGRYV